MPKKPSVVNKAKRVAKEIERKAEQELKQDLRVQLPVSPAPELSVVRPETNEKSAPSTQGIMKHALSYIWSGTDRSRSVLKILEKNTKLTLLSEDESGWTKVRFVGDPDVEGYVLTKMIEKSEE